MTASHGDVNATSQNKFDVIICGSGSAGLAAATWLARYGVRCKILDKRDGPMQMGQADGVQCRTVEIFESLGLSEDLLKTSYHVLEVTFWSHDGSTLRRNKRTADTKAGLSHQPHVILNQAHINKMLIDDMKRSNNQTIDYEYEVKGVEVCRKTASDPDAYSVTVIAEKNGQEERFYGKYVLACDGAHSAIRHSLGVKMVGDSTNSVWGVMDVYPKTNFPDIRKKSVLHGPAGSLMIIPREGDSLARFYIELGKGTDPKKVRLQDLQEAARRIFAPYTMEIAETYWWSAYSIGQRLADSFHQDYRVFLTGDACHTHSPKAGQGMNVSLQDGYNMGWKLGSVLTGQAHPDLLKTYVLERADVAAKLIDFDRSWSKLFSQMSSVKNAVTPEYFSEQFIKNAKYTAGLTAKYQDSMITSDSEESSKLATSLTVGMRFPSTQVVRFSDARAMHLLRALKADGKWRIVVFAGDINKKSSARRLTKFASYLDSPESPIHASAATKPYIDSFIEPLLVLSGKRVEIEQEQIPEIFWPVSGKWAMRDLHKTFVDDESYNSGHGHAYPFYGVNESQGAVVIIRPDQYIAKIIDLEDYDGITEFFSGFALPTSSSLPSPSPSPVTAAATATAVKFQKHNEEEEKLLSSSWDNLDFKRNLGYRPATSHTGAGNNPNAATTNTTTTTTAM